MSNFYTFALIVWISTVAPLVVCQHTHGATPSSEIHYIYDSLNRLVEVHYPDKIIHYTYDDAGNRTGTTVQVLSAAPIITSLNPNGAIVGGSGFTLKINGTNFTGSSVVQWNAEDRTTTFINSSEVRIDLTNADLQNIGTASVTVSNPTPSLLVSNAKTFSVVNAVAVTGRVTFEGNGLENVTINVTGAGSNSAQTDSSGNYSIVALDVGSYTITPSKTNYQFTPVTRTINYSGVSQTDIDFTALFSYAVSGTVTYGNAVSGPTPPRYVSNVLISGAGSPSVSAITGAPGSEAGTYTLTGFGSGSYTFTPTKTTGANSITSFDAARIAQHVSGASNLTGNQLLVADVSNNGFISSFDAAQVARYVTSSPPFGTAGTWKFTPLSRNYASIASSMSGEDYTALLMGEVSGNWTNTGARPFEGGTGPERSTTVNLSGLVAAANSEVIIPISVEGAANKGIISYEFDLRYDPSVIQPLKNPVDLLGTVSGRLSVVANGKEPGLLRVAVYGAMPIEGDGVLLNLRFSAVGTPGSMSPLSFERIMFNEGDPGALARDGRVEITATEPN